MMENRPLVRKLGAFVALSDAELSVLESLHKRRRTFVAGRDLVHQGQSDQAAYILLSGCAVNGGVETSHAAAQNQASFWAASGPAAALSR
jgi:hypothetical protein